MNADTSPSSRLSRVSPVPLTRLTFPSLLGATIAMESTSCAPALVLIFFRHWRNKEPRVEARWSYTTTPTFGNAHRARRSVPLTLLDTNTSLDHRRSSADASAADAFFASRSEAATSSCSFAAASSASRSASDAASAFSAAVFSSSLGV